MKWGKLWRDWRLVYTPDMGKTRFYDPDEWAIRHSNRLDKRTALKYLEIFDDAAFIEKVRGFRKGRKIYKYTKVFIWNDALGCHWCHRKTDSMTEGHDGMCPIPLVAQYKALIKAGRFNLMNRVLFEEEFWSLLADLEERCLTPALRGRSRK